MHLRFEVFETMGFLLWQLGLPLVAFAEMTATSPTPYRDLLTSVGLCLEIASIFAILASKFKKPSILAYLDADLLIGPEIGLSWITDQQPIAVIAEVGLLLLLFIIGLEIDLRKLRASGRPVMVIGLSQFLLCFEFGLAFFPVLGCGWGQTEASGGGLGLLDMVTTAALLRTSKFCPHADRTAVWHSRQNRVTRRL
jgi:Kef-type K+ transport system membrane component KefB